MFSFVFTWSFIVEFKNLKQKFSSQFLKTIEFVYITSSFWYIVFNWIFNLIFSRYKLKSVS